MSSTDNAPEGRDEASAEEISGKPFVLVVDSDPHVRLWIGSDPVLADVEMQFVSDAASARSVMAERMPQLFVVARDLPDAPRLTFIEELSSLPQFVGMRWRLPIIAFAYSPYGTDRVLDPERPEPMWLPKPFNPKELPLFIRRELGLPFGSSARAV